MSERRADDGMGEDEREAEYAAFDVWIKASETRRRMPEWCRAIAEAAWLQGARRARAALAEMEQRKDAAYEERNRVVAALAKAFPSGVARTAIEGWSEDWHGCVYIDLPTGQASWHFHDSQAHLFDGLPAYEKPWDGHTTEQKYQRLAALARPAPFRAAGVLASRVSP